MNEEESNFHNDAFASFINPDNWSRERVTMKFDPALNVSCGKTTWINGFSSSGEMNNIDDLRIVWNLTQVFEIRHA